jgi:NAD(P)-dependent dehydrogenase (short-subunit alcohol dehydrogenase family)
MDPFRGRVAVITGGAGGIGGAMARAFAARGAKLVLADLDEQALALAAKEHRERGAEVHPVATDVTKREQVEALAEATFARFGAAHVICNNAGIAILGPIAQTSAADWEFTMAVNFWGVLYGVDAFLPRLREQRQGGHFVNTASMAGLAGMAFFSAYNASKFAVVGLSECLHRELKPEGIGVSVLCPMIVQTNLTANSLRLRSGDRGIAAPAPEPPAADTMVGGVKQPDEVAARVLRAVERNELYVLTHEEQREILRRRAARLDAVFEPGSWELGDS